MQCPSCGKDSKVIDTRTTDYGSTVKRRRECVSCGKRFTTYEKIEDMPLLVRKKSGRTELFDRSKIMKGLAKACEKRPVTMKRLEEISEEIEKELKNDYREVPSAIIGETIMNRLVDMDEVAYVRFASVYKDFDDVETFIKEIEHLQNKS